MRHDYHVHSTYSDGEFLWSMCRAAADAGLDAVGFADHCNVAERERPREFKKVMGFNLDLTYGRRREAIEHLRERLDIRVFDAVEMDYDPRDADAIEVFLAEADFDYAIGSVHTLEDVNVHAESYFAEKPEDERRALVEEYFDEVVALAESELFEIAAHVDLVERNPSLRGLATEEQYHRVAEAFADSSTVLEVNAGRVHDEYGEFHPAPALLDILSERDVALTLGTDSHAPGEIGERKEELEKFVAAHDIEPVEVVG